MKMSERMTHPLAALIAGVKVKPLEWHEKPEGQDCRIGRCEQIAYAVEQRERFWGFRRGGENGLVVAVGAGNAFSTEAEAMAGADRDHATRILAALEAATPPDLVEAVKVLEGVSGGGWKVVRNRDKTLNVISGPDADGDTHKICLVNGADEANARFIAWCREGVPALIALATAQAAQIKGLEAQAVAMRDAFLSIEHLTESDRIRGIARSARTAAITEADHE